MTQAYPPTGAVLIVGAGPGLGASLAHRFAAGGCPVAVTGRRSEPIEAIAGAVAAAGGEALAVPYDAAVPDEVESAVRKVQNAHGAISTLIYNAGNFVRGSIEEVDPETMQQSLDVGIFGAYLHARLLAPDMRERGAGVMLFTGATSSVMAPAHGPAFAAFKFGLRGLALSLARDLNPDGVHVAHVVLDGTIDSEWAREHWPPEELLEPDAIAEAYWHLANQPRRAWSFELDLRTHLDDYLDN